MIKKLLLSVSLMFNTLLLLAQEKYCFHYLSTGDGLSNSCVQCIFEDHRGCIWIGTESGANIFDGYVVRQVNNKNADGSKIEDYVYSIQEDYLGNIWVNYTGGYFVYTDLTSRYEGAEFMAKFGIELTDDAHVHVDKDGNLWVMDTENIYFHDLRTGRTERNKSALKYEFQQELIVADYDGVLYVLDDELMWRYDMAGLGWKALTLPEELQKTGDRYSFFLDADGNMWIYSLQRELVLRRQGKDTPGWEKVVFPYAEGSDTNQVRFVTTDQDDNIWIATDHRGVFIYDQNLNFIKNVTYERGRSETMASNNVSTIMCDHRGTMWLGHYKKGLSFTHPSFCLLDTHQGEFEDVSALMASSDGTLWVGTDGFGLYAYKNLEMKKLPLPNLIVSSIVEDHDGSIWVGTYGRGIYNLKGNTIKHYTAESGALNHNNSWSLALDNDGRLWYLSGWDPVSIYDPKTGKSEVYRTTSGDVVTGIHLNYDAETSSVYVGTYWGLCVIDSTGVETVYHGNIKGTQEFVNQQISAVCVDRANDILWLGHPEGLTAWDKKNDFIYQFSKAVGLCDDKIKAIITDNDGNVWVSTSNGLMSIEPKRLNTDALTFSIKTFTTSDGLSVNYFNQAAAVGPDGHVLMGGAAGIVEVDPSNIKTNSETNLVPEVLECSVSGKPIPINGLRHLAYNDFQIDIRFFTKEILAATDVQYAYRLMGMNEAWIYTRTPVVSFMSLPPGSYQLQIIASGSSGEWGTPSVIPIYVEAPLYLRWWMKLIYNLLAILIIVGIILVVVRRQKERVRILQEQFEHEQYIRMSEMKLQFFTNMSHDLRTPLTLIMVPLETLVKEQLPEKIHEKLLLMQKNAKQLYSQVSSLLDFRKLDVGAETLRLEQMDIITFINEICMSFSDYCIERKVKFSFNHDDQKLVMQFDPEKLNKILFNLLSNAFKYTPDKGSVTVSVVQKNGVARISIADTGRGVSDEDKPNIFTRFYQSSESGTKTGSGIGLHIASEYVKLHGGEIKVKDNSPRGALFMFTLPIKFVEDVSVKNSNEEIAEIEETESTGKNSKSFTLLVVEDNKDLNNLIKDGIKDEYTVIQAFDGGEALELLEEKNIDLVLTDMMMPRVNGLELCTRIKTDIKLSHIPVLILTAKVTEKDLMESLTAGADDYITKPFIIEHLRLRIRKFIELSAYRHEGFKQQIDVPTSEMTFSTLDDVFLKRALEITENHIGDVDFSVEVLGRELGLTRGHLYKKLMSITGNGPLGFIRTIRMKRGKLLLESGEHSIGEVALMVGYSNLRTFSENFKSEYGMSPSDYVQNLKK